MTSGVIQPAGIGEVAVIGLGLMGSGIAELVARSGRRAVAIEINQDFLDQGMARLHASRRPPARTSTRRPRWGSACRRGR
jgi:3-hydroxyacyl-CoA dehydrogenase